LAKLRISVADLVDENNTAEGMTMDRIKAYPTVPVIDAGVRMPGLTSDVSHRNGTSFALVLAGLAVPTSGAVSVSASQGRLPLAQSNVLKNTVISTAPPSAQGSFHERALGLRAYRQELLASNIANADTPGYKAVDVDVSAALQSGGGVDGSLILKYAVPSQTSVDGNTVEMDVERAKFAQNALMYEYEVDRVKGYYKNMDDLIKNMPY
jgi:flagellar basal-body rod protein FlgB